MKNNNSLFTFIITIEVILLGMVHYFLTIATPHFLASTITSIFFLIVYYHSNKYLFKLIIKNKKEENALKTTLQQHKDKQLNSRRDFFQNLSHEIKTPFAAIQGFVEILLKMKPKEYKKNHKILEKIQKNINRMGSLFEDMDAITKMETGRMQLEKSTFDICLLCDEIIENKKPPTKKGSIKIEKKYTPSKPILIYADKNKIYQVINNLLDNALKYLPNNKKITIKISKQKPSLCLFECIDNGYGIAPKHIGRVFERFYRIEEDRDRKKGGSGLGLAICKHILSLHKSKIHLTSIPYQETNFFFTLPLYKK